MAGILKSIGKGLKKAAKFVAGGGAVGAAARKVSPGGAKVLNAVTNPLGAITLNRIEAPEKKAAEEALARQRIADEEASFNQREIDLEKRYRENRDADLLRGRARGQELFGNNALGRVGEQRSGAISNILNQRQANMTRSGDIAEILAQRKAQLQGYTPEEQQAMREQNTAEIYRNQSAGARDLARQQARSGVRGALGAAQQSAFQQATQAQLADQERQLFLSNIAEKRGALDKFEGSTRTQEQFEREGLDRLEGSTRTTEADELARLQYNLDQLAREKAGMLTTEFGYGGLGAQDRAAILQQILGERSAAATRRIV